MKPLHHRIVDDLVEEYRENPGTVAIALFGSLARGEEKDTSDVDIEIVTTNAHEWELRQYEHPSGIRVDLVICPKEHLISQVERYPYLCYDYLHERILYDPQGFMAAIKSRLEPYFADHPEVVQFWEEKLRIMRALKASGQDPKNAVESYDEAEILFSDEYRVTRDFFRS